MDYNGSTRHCHYFVIFAQTFKTTWRPTLSNLHTQSLNHSLTRSVPLGPPRNPPPTLVDWQVVRLAIASPSRRHRDTDVVDGCVQPSASA